LKHFYLRLKLLLLIVFAQLLFAQNTPYSYSYIPKKVYPNQVFPVTVYAKHYEPNKELSFEFNSLSLMQPLTITPVIIQNQNEAFFTFYFKAPSKEKIIEIPALTIWNSDSNYILNAQELQVVPLPKSNMINFSNLIASEFRIDNVKIDPYDSQYILVTLFLRAKEANLKDFHIPNVIDDGLEKFKRDGANVKAQYYFIVKNSVKGISFSYFDSIKKKFIQKSIDLTKYKNKTIAKDFNPKELTFDKFKKYLSYALIIFFLLLFFITKKRFYLILFIILNLFLLYNYLTKENICIKEGASLYILPTTHSTIFTRIDSKISRDVIRKYRNFYKINLQNDITGWIKDEDVCED